MELTANVKQYLTQHNGVEGSRIEVLTAEYLKNHKVATCCEGEETASLSNPKIVEFLESKGHELVVECWNGPDEPDWPREDVDLLVINAAMKASDEDGETFSELVQDCEGSLRNEEEDDDGWVCFESE